MATSRQLREPAIDCSAARTRMNVRSQVGSSVGASIKPTHHPEDPSIMTARSYALGAVLARRWAAFVEPWTRAVKVRSPGGLVATVLPSQVNETYTNDPRLEPTTDEVVGGSGEVLLHRAGRRVWVAPCESPVDLMRGRAGRLFETDGAFAVALGDTLYRIDPHAAVEGTLDAGATGAREAGPP